MSKAPVPASTDDEIIPVVKSKKKLIVFAIAGLLGLTVVGGGATLFLLKKKTGGKEEAHKEEPAKPPVFINMEPFTVNLQSDAHDKYLQLTMTLQVQDEEQVNNIKTNMPQVRSRLLMLLSSKDADEILTTEGKDKLVKEIITQVKMPFSPKAEPQKVTGVFFTSFVIQ